MPQKKNLTNYRPTPTITLIQNYFGKTWHNTESPHWSGEFRRRIPRRRLPHRRQILKTDSLLTKNSPPKTTSFPKPSSLHLASCTFNHDNLNGLRRQGPFLWIQRCKKFLTNFDEPQTTCKKNNQRWIRFWLWIKPKQYLHQL